MLLFMSVESEKRLETGIAALRSGDRRRARRLLGQVVHDDPDNAAAWWFLAAVLDDPEQRVRCLREVLRLQPGHAEARQLLARLERRIAQVTPPRGIERPVLDARENTQGDLIPVPDEPDPSQRDSTLGEGRNGGDVTAAATVILVALGAILAAIILAWTGAAPGLLGVREPGPEPTDRPLVIGVPACAATAEEKTILVFINNTGVIVDVYRGVAESGERVLTLAPGSQGGVEAEPGLLVRYAVATEAVGFASSSALIEVPQGSMCRVPLE